MTTTSRPSVSIGRCAALVVALGLTVVASTDACTGIRLIAANGDVVCARTLEFAVPVESDVIVVPRGMSYTGSTPDGAAGHTWTTTYAAVGANAFTLPHVVDGLNEKGLGFGLFYFPGFAEYQAVDGGNRDRALAPWELGTYLLTTCADVAEAVEAARQVVVADVVLEEFGFTPPLHYVLHDAAGNSAVLEHVDGELRVHENPLGVITNSPTFDWHMTNLRNYVNLSITSLPPVEAGGVRFQPFGQGSGMLGLPGDFTPPSRFVRAVAFSQSALPVETARGAVLQAFHILNQFDIPRGAAREQDGEEEVADYTLWTSASDLAHQRYFFHTWENRAIRMVDLNACDLDAQGVGFFSMGGPEQIVDISERIRPMEEIDDPPQPTNTRAALIGPRWMLFDLDGRSVPAEAGIDLAFGPDDRATGSTGVNRYFGRYDVSATGSLTFGEMASTQRAGEPDAMARETALLKAIGATRGFRISEQDTLLLLDGDRVLARFIRRPAPTEPVARPDR